MTTAPSITVTRLDLQRLERLLDSLEEYGPAAEALEAELSRANVVGHDEVPPGVVTMNSSVRCREESSGKEYLLTLVYPEDAGGEGKVSILAPVGTALLGLTVGQSIDWPAPGGKTLKLSLLDITYQPEAAGDYNR
ncbi:regulator of nucleoside diphosphate kinase [Pseudomonas citronellolis]|uniref:Regulator of nucleoside diphosphate kinase n=1 Tax=Pseudomonas citronellolis TaxID=53408 RepID=A0AAQ1KJG6_9PSED|nr:MULTISPECIES: nucleoside diphosphate kinase regulator [Pseudomonas]MCL6690469.1 nucleoside diphosphate kinase regulator [Pseudomonas sp. R3.Fl]MCP1607554.1 regulator of nucleoside diphosphate kinase [Pseudomonas citronellolis]MCP1644737.1 regulator of nucleoside diphosphate kinase [Pseudomonas citronellolis]MCP1658481.1 regulator of nucleoside diphosphate kinase [Pseudomonas citronellolis]MCP1665074.1 regulator of nucleoside diphosphate kinase [Pseudomonas citronellolis]